MEPSLKEKFEELEKTIELLKEKLVESSKGRGEIDTLKQKLAELKEKLEQEKGLRQKVLTRVQNLIQKLEKET